jgi:hypothetical protein
MRSVITFENGTSKSGNAGKEEGPQRDKHQEKHEKEAYGNKEKEGKKSAAELGPDDKIHRQCGKPERPSSLYACKDVRPTPLSESDKENKPKQLEEEPMSKPKLTNNRLNNSQAHLIDGSSKETNDAMNNSRKLSLSLSKDALSYRNLLRPGSKNNVASNPPSPTKSYDGFGGSFNNVYIENLESAKQRAAQGSEPNLEKTVSRADLYSYPSLSDMQVQFTSLAAQKILKGCPLNSVDTLVEVNMAAAEKPNNCDVTVHTDFGLV